MLIHDNIAFHNVAELHPASSGGVRLQRVPESVRITLNEGAQMRMLQPDATEIRFVADGPCKVTLSSEGETRLTIFNGLFDSRQRVMLGREPCAVEVELNPQLARLNPSYTRDLVFRPGVYRLIFGGDSRDPVVFHGIEGKNIRPPGPEDVPALRYLAYGTSITHGFDAEGPHLTYVAQTARHLGADLVNLGVGGAAHCEATLADYMAGREDWDIASLALSVNMMAFSMAEFSERVRYMVNTVAGANPARPVACITLYPFSRDWGIETEEECGGSAEEYRQALRDAVADCPHDNVHLIEGPEILTDITGLTADLIHPGDNGMIEMGRNLAARLRPLLA